MTVFWMIYGSLMVVFSVLSACFLAWDKRQARLGRWRVPERRLHLLELAGGWPGSLLARRLFKHKTRKTTYRVKLALILILHAAILIMAAMIQFGLWQPL